MYVSRVSVRNIKSFHGPREVDLTLTRPDGTHAGWTVLAGRNGAGKTTLLRALALVLGGPVAVHGLTQDFENWITQGEEASWVEAEIVRDRDFDKFTGSRRIPGRFITGLGWAAPRVSGNRRTRPLLIELHRAKRTKSTPAQSGPWADNPVGWFCAAYGPFRRMVGGSSEAQRLMLTSGPVARLASLFHEDASLAEGVAWLVEQHLRALEKRDGAMALKNAALAILGDGLLPDGYRIEDVDSEGLWVTRGGHRFPLREMSDGFRTVAALVVDLLKQIYDTFGDAAFGGPPSEGGLFDDHEPVTRVHVPGVVIIDEIDAHLHVTWQRRIGPWLTEHFPRIQFIVTTHSPYICQAADPGGLIRLPGVDEESAPEVVPEDLYERVVFGSGDDAILSEMFGLDTPYSERAELLRAEFVRLEAEVYEGTATPKALARYKELKSLLTSSPTARLDEMSAHLQRLSAEIAEGEAV